MTVIGDVTWYIRTRILKKSGLNFFSRPLVCNLCQNNKIVTPCLNTPAESNPEISPVKICSVKSFPSEKRLDFLPPRQYYITYFTPENIPHHWQSLVNFAFHPMNFDITPAKLLTNLDVWQHLTEIRAMRGNSSSRILG